MRGSIRVLWLTGVFALGTLLAACGSSRPAGQVTNRELPLLDINTPSVVETAAFGMG